MMDSKHSSHGVGKTRIDGLTTLLSLAVAGVFLVLSGFERRRPLRPTRESKRTRLTRNLTIAGLGAATMTLVERPIVDRLAAHVERRRWGLLFSLRLPRVIHVVLAVALLDYTLYLWHVLVHRVPWLWRFHLVHHVDRDLDASTALRFHFGELALSIPWRAAQIIGIGVSPVALRIWQNCLLLSISFHHSNIGLPIAVERAVNRLVVTPRMHGIHHSIVPEETNSNWSSGLTLWDWLHGTLRLNVPQGEITVGVPAYANPEDVTLAKSLASPFQPQRVWQLLPDNGEPPPHEPTGPIDRLLP